MNNVLGRLSDKALKTKVMDGWHVRDLRKIDGLDLPEKLLKRTRMSAAAIYWAGMLAAMGALGFGLPAFCNKVIKSNVQNPQENKLQQLREQRFKKFGF